MATFVRIAALVMILQPAIAFAWPAWSVSDGPKGGFQTNVGTDCEDLSAEPITYGMMYDVPESGLPQSIVDVHDIWLAGGCVGCHQLNSAMNGGLLLNDPGFAAPQLFFPSSRDSTIFRVVEGHPEQSLAYAMLNCTPPPTFPSMPPAVDGISQRVARPLRAMVYDWIAQGARGVDGDGNPISDVLFRDQVESQRFQTNVSPPPPTNAQRSTQR